MIDTLQCKDQQLNKGYFQVGTGPTEVMIVGSCRTVPYAEYLSHSPELTVRRIDPCDWTICGIDLNTLDNDERILSVLKSTKVFIHEYLVNYEMFNTTKTASKNIYQFGMEPEIDITIPNFNDHMILEHDYTAYNAVTPDDYIERGEVEIEKFCSVCDKSSFPEFGALFRDTWRDVRYFWRPNHTSSAFTKSIFKLMNKNYLHLPIGDVTDEDLFCSPCTEVTQRDRDGYGIIW